MDPELIDRAKRGERDAFTALVLATGDRLFSIANNCRDLSDEQAELAGEPAVVLTSDCTGTFDGPGDAAGIQVMHDGRGYMFRLISDGTPDEKALLLDWLSTLQFTEAAGAP